MLMVVACLTLRGFVGAVETSAAVWLSVEVRVLKPESPAVLTMARGGSRR